MLISSLGASTVDGKRRQHSYPSAIHILRILSIVKVWLLPPLLLLLLLQLRLLLQLHLVLLLLVLHARCLLLLQTQRKQLLLPLHLLCLQQTL